MPEFLSLNQITMAAYHCGQKASAEEIAQEIGASARSVRQGLALAGLKLDQKPYGYRPVVTHLSPRQIEAIRSVADSQGLVGLDRHALLLEKAARRLGDDPNLLQAALDLTKSAVILPRDTLEALAVEAKKRALSPLELATRILATVVSDGIVAAVVDG